VRCVIAPLVLALTGWVRRATWRGAFRGKGARFFELDGPFPKRDIPAEDGRPRTAPPIVERVASMQELLSEYFPILLFVVVAGGVSVALIGGSMLIARQAPDSEKLSAYECGFEAFDDARSRFDVRFYLVTLLFIIFDLEVAFLFPWAVALGDIGLFGFWSMVIFLGILTIGFVYEWRKGALEWE
jgi:NADH-quinone oxidoreductase subunit A